MGEGKDDLTGVMNHWGEKKASPMRVNDELSCVDRTVYSIAAGAAAGTFLGACQVAWYPDPVLSPGRAKFYGTSRTVADPSSDFRTVLRNVARPALYLAVAAASYTASECLVESARDRKDSWNAMAGGMVAGAVMGTITKRFDYMTSLALGTGLLMFVADMTGPDSVWEGSQDEVRYQMYGMLPEKHVESERLSDLKEKYPKFKNL